NRGVADDNPLKGLFLKGGGSALNRGGLIEGGPVGGGDGLKSGGPVGGGGGLKSGGPVGGGGGLKSGGPVGGGGGLKSGGSVGSAGGLRLDRDSISRFVAQPRTFLSRFGLGYVPDVPDHRDETFRSIMDLELKAKKLGNDERKILQAIIRRVIAAPPDFESLVDTGNLTPIEDQGEIGSCTAHAVIGLAEYLIKAGTGTLTDLSRMFLYKATRNLMGVQGDTGGFIRTTIKAMAAFGVPPEERWPYSAELLDCEPMAFQYAYAANFKALKYARLDANGLPPKTVLDHVKRSLAAGYPTAFGFPVHDSIRKATWEVPLIPIPGKQHDPQLGGHAVLAVGYDETVKVPGQNDPGVLIIRNSWTNEWGREGYGYLPYYYVLEGLAVDFWTVFSSQWLVERQF
ncbi:MAG: C1 family peptidase, partial [Verrucomicrobiales bacterium]